MTPRGADRVHLPSNQDDYNIHDLQSDDETDDEDAPKKSIPSWATGRIINHMMMIYYFLNNVNFPDFLTRGKYETTFSFVTPPGSAFSNAIRNQCINPPEIRHIFPDAKYRELNLVKLFKKNRPRYLKRTSSACWSPPARPGHVSFNMK